MEIDYHSLTRGLTILLYCFINNSLNLYNSVIIILNDGKSCYLYSY